MMHLTTLEMLLTDAEDEGIVVQNVALPKNTRDIYYNDGIHKPLISLNQLLCTQAEIACTVAEELGHYNTSYGNLLTDPKVDRVIVRQQETRAKRWAVRRLVPLQRIVEAFDTGVKNMAEMAEYIGVTEEFLKKSFEQYNAVFGKYKEEEDHIIYFDPPGVLKKYEGGQSNV